MQALERIYTAYNGRVYNFICSIINDRTLAKDLTQDVFLQIWNKRTGIDCHGNFEAYLFTISKNTVFLYLRRELLMQSYINKQENDIPVQNPEIETNLDRQLLEETIMKLVDELPDARKKVFLLYWKSEMNYREIAEILSISEKTVATQVHRSLQFIRERLDKGILLAFVSALAYCL